MPVGCGGGNCLLLARFTRQLRVRGQDVNDDPGHRSSPIPRCKRRLGAERLACGARVVHRQGGKFDDGVVNRLALALLTEGGLSRTDGVEIQDGTEDPT